VDLTGCNEFTLDTSGLETKPKPSKREGYLEFAGTLKAQFADGSVGCFTDFGKGTNPPLLEIHSAHHRFLMKELELRMWTSSEEGKWQFNEEDSPFPRQSQQTAVIADSILKNGKCDLTPYEESVKIHLQYLEPLKKHLQKAGVDIVNDYPFT
jgi:hypothetical protein